LAQRHSRTQARFPEVLADPEETPPGKAPGTVGATLVSWHARRLNPTDLLALTPSVRPGYDSLVSRSGIDAMLYLLDEAFRGAGIEESDESQALLPNLRSVPDAAWHA